MDGFIILLLVLALVIYFIPSIIGWNKRNSEAIIAVNFFLGWTFVGWVIALVWSLVNDDEQPVRIIQSKVREEDKFDKLKKLKDLLDQKAISESEYAIEKNRLLGITDDVINPGTEIDLKP